MDRRYRGGRAIAAVVDALGWLSAIAGILVAGWAAASMTDGDLAARLLAGVPGFTVTLLGLIAVTVAQLTRAAMDGAEALRRLVAQNADRTGADPVAREALRMAARKAPDARPPESPAPVDPPSAAPRLTLTAAREAGSGRRAPTAPARGRTHPIFSAKPPS